MASHELLELAIARYRNACDEAADAFERHLRSAIAIEQLCRIVDERARAFLAYVAAYGLCLSLGRRPGVASDEESGEKRRGPASAPPCSSHEAPTPAIPVSGSVEAAIAKLRGESGEYFTCPECGATSFNTNDQLHGYCGRCHDFTGASPEVIV